MTSRRASVLSRMVEGSTIALDSIRSNKVRAGLTILGVAIGVTVVIAMASAITGINRSITGILESAGPKTFFVYRYFSGGLDVSDGSDELSPWRRMPWITTDEAELIRQLPTVRDVNIGEYTNGPVSFEGVELKSVAMAGMSPSWNLVNGATSSPAETLLRWNTPPLLGLSSSMTSWRARCSPGATPSVRRSRFSGSRSR